MPFGWFPRLLIPRKDRMTRPGLSRIPSVGEKQLDFSVFDREYVRYHAGMVMAIIIVPEILRYEMG